MSNSKPDLNTNAITKTDSELVRKNYTDEEITLIYELARLSFESGNHRRAEILARGLIAVAPDFIPSYIVLAMVLAFSKIYDQANDLLQTVLRLNEHSLEAQLLAASIYLTQGNYTMAGTMLGEAAEQIKFASDVAPSLKSFYQIQLARFEGR